MLPAQLDGRENTLFKMQCKCSDTNVVTVLATGKKVGDVASRVGWKGKYMYLESSSATNCTTTEQNGNYPVPDAFHWQGK